MNFVHVSAMSEAEAEALPNVGSFYNTPGVRVNIDNENCWLESREEVNEVIADLLKAADKLWPKA